MVATGVIVAGFNVNIHVDYPLGTRLAMCTFTVWLFSFVGGMQRWNDLGHEFFLKGTVQLREVLYKIIKFMQTLDASR